MALEMGWEGARQVLRTLYELGAPESVLVSGSPHLGTDRLVRILKAFRARLLALGVTIRWGTAIRSVTVRGQDATGVTLAGPSPVVCSPSPPPGLRMSDAPCAAASPHHRSISQSILLGIVASRFCDVAACKACAPLAVQQCCPEAIFLRLCTDLADVVT